MNDKVKSVMVALAALFAAGTAMGASVAFDLRPTRKIMKVAAAPAGEPTGVLRATSLAAGKTLTGPLAVGDELSFALFDDVTVTLSLAERTEAPLGGETFLAEVSGYDGMKNAVVMQTSDGLQVDVQDFRKNRVYSIVSTAKGTSVREFDPQAGKVIPTRPLVPELSKADSLMTVQSTVMASSQSTDQASTLVDVLVAFDRNAVTYANQNEGGMDNFANMAVAKMNTALANNGMSSFFRFRLVGTMAVDASATDVHTGLYAIRDSQAGWAAIKAKREEVGADIVTTLIDTGSAYGTTGVGWSLADPSRLAEFADSAYNVCAIRSVAQSHTMTHETGHNMGAGHATAVADEDNRGPQLYSYSSGHYFTGSDGKAYHTIMAYNSDGYGNSYTEAPLFSSPNCMWAGVAAGDAKHDNAQTIKNTYQSASAWREQKIAMSYDVFFSPETRTMFSDPLDVTLTAGKSGLPIYYTLDGSTPTTSSQRYTDAIRLTSTTTIKAIAVVDGVAGPVYEATYYKSGLGTALNAPQLVWNTSESYPWTSQTGDTYDGVAAQSGSIPKGGYYGDGYESWLSTTVSGPTVMSFRYKTQFWASDFRVTVDGKEAFKTTDEADEWTTAEVDISGQGTHTVRFSYFQRGYYYDPTVCGVWLDTVQFDALSRPPTMSPVSTTVESTATTFVGSMTVTLTPPSGQVGVLYYTLDGSDPTGDDALVYDGTPLTLTKSTLVRAVFVEGGKEPSVFAEGLFLERHPVRPGEWTTDVEGAQKAAKENGGKLIAVLLANEGGCSWTQRFTPNAESQSFLSWARQNGVYLINADQSRNVDAAMAYSYFWDLCYAYTGDWSSAYPQLYFVLPRDVDKPIAQGLARNDGSSVIGTERYLDTVESLVAGFASVMTSQGLSPTAYVMPDAADILGTIGIQWTNDSATPWREAYPNQMRGGGLMKGAAYSSKLSARVSGKGTFKFSYRTRSSSWQNTYAFNVNGNQRFGTTNSGATSDTVSVDVTDAVGAVFEWVCDVKSPDYDLDERYTTPSGFWIYDVSWTPAEPEEVFPSVGDLAAVFGADSDMAKRVTTAEELAKVNEFAASVRLASVANLTLAQKEHFYESYVLSAIMKTPALLTEEPKLEISSFGANASNAANWDLSVSLSAGNQNLEMIAEELRKMVRVGTDVRDVNDAAKVLATPSDDGATVTLTIQKPGTTAGFVRIVVVK